MRHGILGILGLMLGTTAMAQGIPMFDETAGYQVTGLSQSGRAAVLNRGHNFICEVAGADGRAILDNCVPVLTPSQQAKIEADSAMVERMAEMEAALAASKADLASANANIADLQNELETAKANMKDMVAEAAEQSASLTQTANQNSARVTELEAELDEALYAVALRPLIIDLEGMSVDVALRAPDQGVILAREGLQLVADTFGDGCVLTQEMFDTNMIEIQKLVQGAWLSGLGVREEVAKLMIAEDEPDTYPEDMKRFRNALDAARDAGDGPTYDKGREALRIAANAMNTLDAATTAGVPEVVTFQEDGTMRIKSVPCRQP